MRKTVESIKKKWQLRTFEMETKREHQTKYEIERRKDRLYNNAEKEFDRKVEKLKKKEQAYINKKREEYRKKMMNEIRDFQGKPQKVYKQKPLKNTQKLQIALAIMQENSRLRDTNKDGIGFCISCGRGCGWEELAGGHWKSRQMLSVCLRPENINAQCHKCNYTTGPKGNVKEKEQVNERYRQEIIKKYGDQIVAEIEEHVRDEIKNPHKYRVTGPFLDELVPELIKENKRLRATKSPEFLFSHKPAKNRQKVYEKYRNLSNN